MNDKIRIGKPVHKNPHICAFCSKDCGSEFYSTECLEKFKEILKRLMKE